MSYPFRVSGILKRMSSTCSLIFQNGIKDQELHKALEIEPELNFCRPKVRVVTIEDYSDAAGSKMKRIEKLLVHAQH